MSHTCALYLILNSEKRYISILVYSLIFWTIEPPTPPSVSCGKYFYNYLPFCHRSQRPPFPPLALQTAFKTIIGILRQDQWWPGSERGGGGVGAFRRWQCSQCLCCSASNYTRGTEIGRSLLNSYQIKISKKGLADGSNPAILPHFPPLPANSPPFRPTAAHPQPSFS